MLLLQVYHRNTVVNTMLPSQHLSISRYTDPLHIKMKKIELLSEICMFESAREILSELKQVILKSVAVIECL